MTPNPNRTLQATLLTMIAMQTVGTVDRRRRMPSPRQFTGVAVAWGMLFLLAELGQGKFAARLSLLLLLPALLLGPFGKRLLVWMEFVSHAFQSPPEDTTTGAAGASAVNTTPGTVTVGFSPDQQGTDTFPAPVSPVRTRFS